MVLPELFAVTTRGHASEHEAGSRDVARAAELESSRATARLRGNPFVRSQGVLGPRARASRAAHDLRILSGLLCAAS